MSISSSFNSTSQHLPAALAKMIANFGGHVKIQPLQQDASSRRYWRFFQKHRTVLGVTTDNIAIDLLAFQKIQIQLDQWGLSAPRFFEIDHINGCALIQDFGNLSFTHAMKLPQEGIKEHLYILALKNLIKLHKNSIFNQKSQAFLADLPSYDIQILTQEANRFVKDYLPTLHQLISKTIAF